MFIIDLDELLTDGIAKKSTVRIFSLFPAVVGFITGVWHLVRPSPKCARSNLSGRKPQNVTKTNAVQ